MITKRTLIGALGGAAAVALSLAPAASASTVRAGGNSVSFYAAPGEANRLIVDYVNGAFVVTDQVVTLKADSGCTRITIHQARCAGAATALITAYADDRNDTLDIRAGGASYTIAGGAGDDLILGTQGNDIISGGPGADVINGRGGEDYMSGNEGPDRMSGGPGVRDVVSYAGSTLPIRADLEGGADDGAPGEGDQIDPDVENLIGGRVNDDLIGNASDNRIDGLDGDDLIAGHGGRDALEGNRGADILRGDDGKDTLNGDTTAGDTPGRDVLIGGSDADELNGGPLGDYLYGEAGPDTLHGADGPDVLLGGTEIDTLYGEKGDDDLRGDPGDDLLLGAQGNDTLEGGIGGDSFFGGTGTDTANYADRFDPVRISLDDLANDGWAGERDSVRTDIEKVLGGHGNDTLLGNAAPQTLSGNDGKDMIDAGGGVDTVNGGAMDDLLVTRDGKTDRVDCGLGRDTAVVGRDYENPLLACEIRDHRAG